MPADIHLHEDHVLMKTTDIQLDGGAGRRGSPGPRRAFVHGPQDDLVLNWEADYPAGVRIQGPLWIQGALKVEGQLEVRSPVGAPGHLRVETTDLHLDGGAQRRLNKPGERRALVHGFEDEIVVNWGNDYTGGVRLASATRVEGDLKVSRDINLEGRLLVHLPTPDAPAPPSAPPPADAGGHAHPHAVQPPAGHGLPAVGRLGSLHRLLGNANLLQALQKVDLLDIVAELSEQVEKLEDRIRALESRPH